MKCRHSCEYFNSTLQWTPVAAVEFNTILIDFIMRTIKPLKGSRLCLRCLPLPMHSSPEGLHGAGEGEPNRKLLDFLLLYDKFSPPHNVCTVIIFLTIGMDYLKSIREGHNCTCQYCFFFQYKFHALCNFRLMII